MSPILTSNSPPLDKEAIDIFCRNKWLKLGDTNAIVTKNPFENLTDFEIANPHIHLLDMMRKPENFGFTCSLLFEKYKHLAPFQIAILRELWHRPFPMLIGSRGLSKTYLLALYCMLRSLFDQGRRIVIVGAAFRQAKVVFDYCQNFWEDSPVLRSIVGNSKHNGPRRDVDMCSLRLGDSQIVCLPLGDGTKIRGQRASIVIAEEFASIGVDIFETVVRGFGAVSSNPVEKMRHEAYKDGLKELGLWSDAHERLEEAQMSANQTIISGTAYYSFNHFYGYWKRYKAIIESRGDKGKLEEIFGGKIPTHFNWKDFCVIRIPAERLPNGFMDAKQLAQAKATVHLGIYKMEYGAVFLADSNGFFPRSLIEKCCVGKPDEPIILPSCGEVIFNGTLRGHPNKQYVIAVDPASERDNFSVVVLECYGDHRRIVHCWTTTRARFKAKAKRGLTDGEDDFYSYAARKIRQLMRWFPCVRLAIDSQGGGIAIIEALQDSKRIPPGEKLILPVIDPEAPKDTDDIVGDHCLEVISFSNADWVATANHGLKKDLQDRVLMFPKFDTGLSALALEEDKAAGRIKLDTSDPNGERLDRLYDTLDDCMWEIEQIKDELATIVHSQTGTTMRDHWDTPAVRIEGGKKGRLRKDRYTSLLMANMTARTLAMIVKPADFKSVGGFAHNLQNRGKAPQNARGGPLYIAPAWFSENQYCGGGFAKPTQVAHKGRDR